MSRHHIFSRGLALLLLAAAAFPAISDELRDEAIATIKRDFKPRGSADLNRLVEDPVQAACNSSGNHPGADVAARLTDEQLAAIKFPADGKLMGNWQAGEKIAQNGRGFTWSDKPGIEVGGNCYNCHQIAPKEMSYGTVGPTLYRLGKLRGSGPDMQRYVYGKIYNAKAYNLCSAMPRFGHIGALSEQQIKDLVALLLDPASPVNQ
jgi:sulfur-oxidizing protein SoxX